MAFETVLEAALEAAMDAALDVAETFVGATAPNPPVGAAAFDASGTVLAAAAHERAGRAHAEAVLLEILASRGLLKKVHTLVVTLEPCNHTGRTPPCTEALIQSKIPRVAYLCADPNPLASGGAHCLREAGIEVLGPEELASRLTALRARRLRLQLGPFLKRVSSGLPWVTVKRAFDLEGSMIPPAGKKTFTSKTSLRLAHSLRKRADVILTASGTVLADHPQFTVREVADHPGKIRALWIADRRRRVPESYLHTALGRGFMAERVEDWQAALAEAGKMGALEVLVEAGPSFSGQVLASDFWDRRIDIHLSPGHTLSPDLPKEAEDRVDELFRAP
ncbi:MAG: bifunctional diaminohydroxyphosphoribosylaminopyrimidine deaminase/5-amino-6-(5-phosphoribosylamino)uracil reductase RibD [Oligoflexia bacterium]